MATCIPLELVPPAMLHVLYARRFADLTLILQDIADLPHLSEDQRQKKIFETVHLYLLSVTNRGRQPNPPRL